MKIFKIMAIAALLVLSGSVASAQQSKSDETLEFRPHWSMGVQGGAGYTLGKANFGKLVSPAAVLNFQWQFHHAFGLRLGLGGWQGKGVVNAPEEAIFPFRYGQINADVLMDLTSLIGGFDHKRLCSAYVFAGVGAAYGFDNASAVPYMAELQHYWENKFFVPGRFGAGVDFRLSDVVSLGLEANAGMYSDKFDSKYEEKSPLDWQFNLLGNLKFRLGKNTRPYQGSSDKVGADDAAAVAAAAAAAAAAAEAERLAAEKAAAEKAAAEKAAAEKAAAEKAAAEKAAAEKAAAEKAAAERAALASENSKDMKFAIGSAVIRKGDDAKLVELAEFLKANPDFSVDVVGYADRETGNPQINLEVSKKRAEAVAAKLVSLGVEESRITVDYKGDTVQPFPINEQNRVVICTVK